MVTIREVESEEGDSLRNEENFTDEEENMNMSQGDD